MQSNTGMRAWRVHRHRVPSDALRLDRIAVTLRRQGGWVSRICPPRSTKWISGRRWDGQWSESELARLDSANDQLRKTTHLIAQYTYTASQTPATIRDS
jgi:hypothetical protein